MTRYFIKDVKCGVAGGGVACGPVPGTVTGSIQFKKDYGPFSWITLSDVAGIANFYLTEEDIYDKVQDIDGDDEEFIDKLNDDYFIRSFDGISFGEYGEYRDVFRSIEEKDVQGNCCNTPILLLRRKDISTFISQPVRQVYMRNTATLSGK